MIVKAENFKLQMMGFLLCHLLMYKQATCYHNAKMSSCWTLLRTIEIFIQQIVLFSCHSNPVLFAEARLHVVCPLRLSNETAEKIAKYIFAIKNR